MESWSFPFSCDVGRSHTPNKRVLNFIRYGEPGNPKSNIPGWAVVKNGSIHEGDIGAYTHRSLNATGHMGIMVINDNKMFIVYAGSSIDPYHIRGSIFSNWQGPKWTIWRYIGK